MLDTLQQENSRRLIVKALLVGHFRLLCRVPLLTFHKASASAVPSPSPAPGSPNVPSPAPAPTASSGTATPPAPTTSSAPINSDNFYKPVPTPAPAPSPAPPTATTPAPKRRESLLGAPRTHKTDGIEFHKGEGSTGDKTRDTCVQLVYDALASDSDARSCAFYNLLAFRMFH